MVPGCRFEVDAGQASTGAPSWFAVARGRICQQRDRSRSIRAGSVPMPALTEMVRRLVGLRPTWRESRPLRTMPRPTCCSRRAKTDEALETVA